jgi:hypothetical protein
MVGGGVLARLLRQNRDVRPMLNTRDLQPGARVSSFAVSHDRDALDAATGCEYVDDRIRLQE